MVNNEVKEEDYEDIIVTFTDEEGSELLYRQEMIIPVDGVEYALLVGIEPDDEAMTYRDDEDNVIIAKIVKGDDGEDEYIDPTDEEFDAVQKVYDEMMDELEANEK